MLVRTLLTSLGFDVNTRGMQRYENGLRSIMKTTVTFAAVTATAIAALGTLFFKGAGEIEQIEVAFETMLGSAEKAKNLLMDITKFAEKTPFQLLEVTKASKQLLAFGIAGDQIIDTMTNLGNISAGIGRNKLGTLVRAFGKIRTKGRASMEELNMMLEAGVPILDEIAKTMNMKVGPALFNLVEKGVVNFDIVNKSIKSLSTGTGKFADLMIKQSKTLLGIISNIKDVFTNLINAIGKDLLPEGKRLARLFLEWITLNKAMIRLNVVKFYNKLLLAIQKLVAFFDKFKIIGNIGDLLRFLMSVVRIFGDVINRVFMKDGEGIITFMARWVNENKKLIATKIVGFVLKAAFVFEKLLRVAKEMHPWIIALVGALVTYKLAMAAIAIFNVITNPMYLAIAAIIGFIGAIIWAKKNWVVFMEILKGFKDDIAEFFKPFTDGLKEVVNNTIADFILVRDFMWDTWFEIAGFIEKLLLDALSRIQASFTEMGDFLKKIFDGIFGENAFSKTLERIQLIIDAAQELLAKLDLVSRAKDLGGKIQDVGGRAQDSIQAALDTLALGGNKQGTSNTLTVEAVIAVPAGTPTEQLAVVQEGSDKIFTSIMDKLRGDGGLSALEAFK